MRAALLLTTLLVLLPGWTTRLAAAQQPAQPAPPAPAEPIDVPLCQLLADPGTYNHQLVRVTGRVVHKFEVNALEDDECSSPNRAWLELAGTAGAREGIEVRLVEDAQLESFRRIPWTGRHHATLICRYFSGTLHEGPYGIRRWEGYGHLGAYTLLVIQQVVAVDEAPAPLR
jgi:hypothetical protein